jgi:hypothetical protein
MSGGGGSGSDGGDMQVSGAEAAVSKEKGISTHADTRISRESFSPGGSNIGDKGGVHDTGPQLGPDTSTVGMAAPTHSSSEVEKGYTDKGDKLYNVSGTYMTKSQMYSTGVVEKDPETGKDVQGRYRVNPNSGEFERADLSFAEHWANRPNAIKFSPALSLLYAGGKNISEIFKNKNFKGYNEEGLITGTSWKSGGSGGSGGNGQYVEGSSRGDQGMSESQMMHAVSPHAPFIVSGTTAPSTSASANWYNTLGGSGTNPTGFNLFTEYAAAKAKISKTLNTSSSVGQIAVGNSAFFNFLKDNSLNKGIL